MAAPVASFHLENADLIITNLEKMAAKTADRIATAAMTAAADAWW
mgnify:CR=1 FL=1